VTEFQQLKKKKIDQILIEITKIKKNTKREKGKYSRNIIMESREVVAKIKRPLDGVVHFSR